MILRGKFLVRIATNGSGKKKIILSGVFDPIDFDIESIDTNDEMWVSDFMALPNGIRFSGKIKGALSTEDFLEGVCMSPSDWSKKEELKL